MRITAIWVYLFVCLGYTQSSPITIQLSGDYPISGVIGIDLNIMAKKVSSDETTVPTTEKYDPDVCGITAASRIIGGKEVDPHQYPWTAAILVKGKRGVWCGASVLKRQYVLTAAHCLIKNQTFRFEKCQAKIRLGAHLVNAEKDPEQESRDFEVDEWKPHKGYDYYTKENDIALIKLKTPIVYGDSIRPICLPEKGEQVEPDQPITAVGWGTTTWGSNTTNNSEELLGVDLETWSFEKCRDAFPEGKITESMFCAFNRGKDTCSGDSGGPAMMRAKSKQWNIVGVTSWGFGCAQRYPGVYARVSNYIDWIEKSMENLN